MLVFYACNILLHEDVHICSTLIYVDKKMTGLLSKHPPCSHYDLHSSNLNGELVEYPVMNQCHPPTLHVTSLDDGSGGPASGHQPTLDNYLQSAPLPQTIERQPTMEPKSTSIHEVSSPFILTQGRSWAIPVTRATPWTG